MSLSRRGDFAFFSFTVPVKSKLQADEFFWGGTFEFGHGIFEALAVFVLTNDLFVLFHVSSEGWSSLILFNNCFIVLSAGFISLSVKFYWLHFLRGTECFH